MNNTAFSEIFFTMFNDRRTLQRIGISLLLALSAAGCWFGYSWYRSGVEARAYKAFAENLELYHAAVKLDAERAWEDALEGFSKGFNDHTSSALAPYFLSMQAEILIQQNKRQEALTLLQKAVKGMNQYNALTDLYKVKLALLMIESGEVALQEEGNVVLRKISEDTHSPAQDMALYYRGEFALSSNGLAAAEEVWAPLLADEANTSYWRHRAQLYTDKK